MTKRWRGGVAGDGTQAEAELAAALFVELRHVLCTAASKGKSPGRIAVGVITFYRAQVLQLRETFQALAGDAAAAEVGTQVLWQAGCTQLDRSPSCTARYC